MFKRLFKLMAAGALLGLITVAPAQQEKRPVYVGARVCGSCHTGGSMGHQHGKWLSSKHALAYAALAKPEARAMAELSGITENPTRAPICLG